MQRDEVEAVAAEIGEIARVLSKVLHVHEVGLARGLRGDPHVLGAHVDADEPRARVRRRERVERHARAGSDFAEGERSRGRRRHAGERGEHAERPGLELAMVAARVRHAGERFERRFHRDSLNRGGASQSRKDAPRSISQKRDRWRNHDAGRA